METKLAEMFVFRRAKVNVHREDWLAVARQIRWEFLPCLVANHRVADEPAETPVSH